jgi:hypothetical protein
MTGLFVNPNGNGNYAIVASGTVVGISVADIANTNVRNMSKITVTAAVKATHIETIAAVAPQ